MCVWRAGDQSGIEVGAGGVLQQQGKLQVSVRAFLADGVRLASGASWLQLGSATISAGQAGHDRDFSLNNGVLVEANASWHQTGPLTVLAHGSIGVFLSLGGRWEQSGPASLTIVGQGDSQSRGDLGTVFGEAVRLGRDATWLQTGSVSVTATNASSAVFLPTGST